MTAPPSWWEDAVDACCTALTKRPIAHGPLSANRRQAGGSESNLADFGLVTLPWLLTLISQATWIHFFVYERRSHELHHLRGPHEQDYPLSILGSYQSLAGKAVHGLSETFVLNRRLHSFPGGCQLPVSVLSVALWKSALIRKLCPHYHLKR